MRLEGCWLGLLLLAPAAWAQPSATPDSAKPPGSSFHITLAPQSMSETPTYYLTAVTEFTDAGRKLAPVSPGQPAYYVPDSAGYQEFGDSIAGQATLSEDEMSQLMARALASRGYLAADSARRPPSLLIVYTWGSHSKLGHMNWNAMDAAAATGATGTSAAAEERNLIERASLVGGDDFARNLQHMMMLEYDHKLAHIRGDSMSPIRIFRLSDETNDHLIDQSSGDIFFIVASAYDYGAAARHQRVLLWRTKMTVGAGGGVRQDEALPTLMLTAARYLGRPMGKAAYLRQRSLGRVEIGPLRVVGTEAGPGGTEGAEAPPAKAAPGR